MKKRKLIISLAYLLTLTSCDLDILNRSGSSNSYYNQLEDYYSQMINGFSDYNISIPDELISELTQPSKVLYIGDSKEDNDSFAGLDLFSSSTYTADVTYYTDDDENLPYSYADLSAYDAIILSDIDVSAFEHASEFVTSLNKTVKETGTNLLTLGDVKLHTYSSDADSDDELAVPAYITTFEELLPIDYQERVNAFEFCVDTSGSMATDSRLEKVKNGLKKAIDLLHEDDYFGLVSFETESKIVSQIRTSYNRSYILRKINSLQEGGSTYMDPGLVNSYKQLKDIKSGNKHIITLSDGQPFETKDTLYKRTKMIANQDITCSFINICDSSSSSISLLKNLANYGGGTYKYCSNATQIASTIANIVEEYLTEGEIVAPSDISLTDLGKDILGDINNNTNTRLDGFYRGETKDDATELVSVKTTETKTDEEGEEYEEDVTYPLISAKTQGQGTVASFTSSLSSDWTIDFRKSDYGQAILKGLAALLR